MLGSSASVADPNIVLNTIVAEALRQYADELEKATDFTSAVAAIVKRTIKKHRRIIFNGNGYSEEWKEEAKKRGLYNLKTTVDALPVMLEKKNIDVFVRHKVYTEAEIRSRYEIQLENYSKIVNIEALTAIDMVRKEYIPAVSGYTGELAATVNAKRSISPDIKCDAETAIIGKLTDLISSMYKSADELEIAEKEAQSLTFKAQADAFCYKVIPIMAALRSAVDDAERITAKDYWPVPNYGDLMYRV